MRFRSTFCFLTSVSIGALCARAQTFIWTNSLDNGSFSTGANWQGGSAPVSGQSIQFGSTALPGVVLDEGYAANTIFFDTGTTAFNITGSFAFTLQGGGIDDASTSSSQDVFNVPIILTSSISIQNATTNAGLVLTGGISGSGFGISLYSGGLLALGGTSNTFSGTLDIESGTITDLNAQAFPSTALVEVASGGVLAVNHSETISALSDNVTGGSVVIANGMSLLMSGPYTTTFSGVISGQGGIEKDNSGTLILAGANTYTGPTVVGTASVSAIQIGNGGSTGSLMSSGVSGPGDLAFNLSVGSPYTYSGVLSGALHVDQEGAGIITLSGTNTYSGATTIFTGTTLSAGSMSAFGGAGNSPITINGTGTLDLNSMSNTVGSISGGPGSNITLGTGTLSIGATSGTSTFSGTIAGAGFLDITGLGGTTVLAGANSYSGGTTVNSGVLQVTSGGSISQSAAQLAVGVNPGDSGTLLINNGGTVADDIGILGGNSSSIGAVTVDGTGSTLGLVDNLYVGYSGTGTLSITNGGAVTANQIYLGYSTSSAGTVIVDGANSSLTNSNGTMYVGNSSGGLLTLSNGGTVSVGSGDGTVVLGALTGGYGNLYIGGQGTNPAVAGGFLKAAQVNDVNGVGSLEFNTTATSGSKYYFTSNGTLGGGPIAISGPISLSNVAGYNVLTGANTYSVNTLVEFGTLEINGGSITLTNISGDGSVQVGDFSGNNGTLNVTNGGSVSDTIGYMGLIAGSVGTVNVTGSGSSWTDSNAMNVGFNGTGTLNVSGGGTVTTPNLFIGYYSTAAGTVTVDGAGSSVSASNLSIGYSGSGILTLSNGGIMNVGGGTGTVVFAQNVAGSSGELNIGATAGNPAAAGGFLNAAGVITFPGAGTVQFNTTATSGSPYYFTSDGTSGGSGVVIQSTTQVANTAGYTVLKGPSTYSGLTSVNGGTLADGVANSFSPYSDVLVNSAGGHLQVNYNENVGSLQNGGTGGPVFIAPGATLTSNGNDYTPMSDFEGTITGGGSFSIAGGVQGLRGNNGYTGGTQILNSGELFVASDNAIGTGMLTLNGSGTELSPDGTNVTLGNAISLINGSVLDNDDGGNYGLTLAGQISGNGGIEWCTNGVLTLTYLGNSFTGTIDMREGTLLLASGLSSGLGGITMGPNSILSADGTGISLSVPNAISLEGGPIQLGNNDNDNILLTGGLSGSGMITYEGGSSGIITLVTNNSGLAANFSAVSGTVDADNNQAFGPNTNSVWLTNGSRLFVSNGIIITNPVNTAGPGNVLTGTGTIGQSSPITVNGSIIVSPSSAISANAPGVLSFSSGLAIASGGSLSMHLYDATGAAGVGFNEIAVTGGLDLSLASAASITFDLISVDAGGASANALNFNSANPYSLTFLTTTTGITGFTGNQFLISSGTFTNPTNGGVFSIIQVGNDLNLNFTPVPEPSTWILMGAGIVALAGIGLRRRRSVKV
jgi:fibronectin-binding autotransporter adhesin